jgi:hypothetical protein
VQISDIPEKQQKSARFWILPSELSTQIVDVLILAAGVISVQPSKESPRGSKSYEWNTAATHTKKASPFALGADQSGVENCLHTNSPFLINMKQVGFKVRPK